MADRNQEKRTDEELGRDLKSSLKSLENLTPKTRPVDGVFSDTLPFTQKDVEDKIDEIKKKK